MSWNNIIGQVQQKNILRTAITSSRLPNAYLFFGQEGVGKEATAIEVAKTLNCLSSDAIADAEACGHCASCEKFQDLSHPNLELVFPIEGILLENVSENSSKREKHEEALEKLKQLYQEKRQNPYYTMKMDKAMGILTKQVELLIDKAIFKPTGNKKRIFIISQAERMNQEAANKLLKLLEEPPSYVLFILVSSRPEQLLQTIVSRCQPIRFSALPIAEIASALQHEGLEASDDQNAVEFASRFSRGNFSLAKKVLTDNSIKELRDKSLNMLRFALSSGKQLELMREIDDLAKLNRNALLQAIEAMLLVFQDVSRTIAIQENASLINQDIADTIKRFAQNFPDADFDVASREVEHARYAISRNANPSLTLTALAITLKAILRRENLLSS